MVPEPEHVVGVTGADREAPATSSATRDLSLRAGIAAPPEPYGRRAPRSRDGGATKAGHSRPRWLAIPVKIGHLDPVDTISGQQARLSNLGYFLGDIDGNDASAFRIAVGEFQCEHGLTVDGICGSKTQAKLKDAHGC
jgi:Putative peptidoglycan binding domain